MAFILITAPTSGTASLGRIVKTIAGSGRRTLRLPTKAATQAGIADTTFVDPNADNTVYWFQGPRHWNADIDLSSFKVIVHIRDPRDLACNQYYWALQHPNTKDTPEEVERKRLKTEKLGIEKFALARNNFAAYAPMLQISDSEAGDHAAYTSYAQLCVAFDYLTDTLCRTFDRRPSGVARDLQNERPENLTLNPDWVKVGGTWQGTDISPGRFRRELGPETARAITEKWQRELKFCQHRDAPFLAHHYEA